MRARHLGLCDRVSADARHLSLDHRVVKSMALHIDTKKTHGGEKEMNGNRSNRVEVPEAKAAMDRFKTEVASELGVNLKDGYNGDLTSREAGSIGGEMVRRMIRKRA